MTKSPKGVSYFCTDSSGNTYTRYSARHLKAEYLFAGMYRREGTTAAVGKGNLSYSRTRQNVVNVMARFNGYTVNRSHIDGKWVDDPHKLVTEILEVRAYPGRHTVENDAIAATENVGGEVPYWNETVSRLETQPTKANTQLSEWWQLLNAELVKAGAAEATFDDARGCYDMGESPQTAAVSLLAVREG